MEVQVIIIFPEERYKTGEFKQLIEHLAKKYNSIGSLVWMKGDEPYLQCITKVSKINKLLLDCYSNGDSGIKIKITFKKYKLI